MAKGGNKLVAKAAAAEVRKARREARAERVQDRRARRGQVAVPELRDRRLPLPLRRGQLRPVPRRPGQLPPDTGVPPAVEPTPAAVSAPVSSGNSVDDLLAKLQDPNLTPKQRRQLRLLLRAAQRSERIKSRERIRTARIESREKVGLAKAEAQQAFIDKQRAKIEAQGDRIEDLKEDLDLAGGAGIDPAAFLADAEPAEPSGGPGSTGPSSALILGGLAALVGGLVLFRRRKKKGGK